MLLALNRHTGRTTTNAPIAIAGTTVLVPAGGLAGKARSRDPQLVAYTVH